MTTSQVRVAMPGDSTATPWAALPVLAAGTFLVVLDFFIVNVAMPSLQSGLGATAGELEWVVAGYGLTLAALLLTSARLGDRFGHRRVYTIGVAVFTLCSLACALSQSPGMLVAARLVQGAGAAAISPAVLSLIGVLFRGPDRARAISVYGGVMGVAAAGGQIIGGALIDADVAGLGWRLIFAINIPVGIAVLLLAPRLVPESKSQRAPGVDPLGLVLSTLAMTALVLPLIEGREAHWAAWTWEVLAISGLLIALTAAQQRRLGRRGGSPLFPATLVQTPTFRAGLTLQLVYWCGQASFYLFLALYLQTGRGLSPLQSGLMFAILATAYLVTSTKAPALLASLGRSLVTAGAVAILGGYAALLAALAAGSSGNILLLAPGLALVGAGQGMCITPIAATVLAHAAPEQAGAVSGALSAVQQVGNCLGVAAIGVVFFAAHATVASSFGWSLVPLGGVTLVVILLSRLLPTRHAQAALEEAAAA